ncbi:MAG: NADH:ubiquinone oxidoreductase [Calditrichaeota bacterium]|nr:nickel-dependent hydrogenase large subunit [Calditrichota bacterium]RQW04981.1 MAG: NADH:ubiquinone oxidoreductase [Calditrichota bacterium]
MRSIIPIGPFHPLQDEPENFVLTVEGETVVDIDANIGYIHKGIELLAQQKTYDQVVFLVERICGICSITHTQCFCNAVEDLLQMDVPERAKYIRTILGEIERIHSHLLWMGLAGHFIGYNTVFMWVWKYREPILDMMEYLTGNRQSCGMLKVGGVRRDLDNEKFPALIETVDKLEPQIKMLADAVQDDPVLKARLKGVGVLTKKDAIDYCVVGPTARASGLDIDVRKDEPYAAYPYIDWNTVVLPNGDVYDKFLVRTLEVLESIKIIRQAVKQIPGGEFLQKVEHIPVGEGIGLYEAPRGEDIHYVRSNGSNYPERVKVRAPSFINIPSFHASCIGQQVADVTITLAAVDPCYSCTERMISAHSPNRSMRWSQEDLVSISQKKTRDIASQLGKEYDLPSLRKKLL